MSAALNRSADLGKMILRGGRVAPGHDEPGAFALRRRDGAENVSPSGALIMRRGWPASTPRPAASDLVLLSNPGLVLEPDFYWRSRRELLLDRRQLVGEVLLNASMISGS